MRRILLLHNPSSGPKARRNVLGTVISEFSRAGYDVILHRMRFDSSDSEALAEAAPIADMVCVCGGDGTVSHAVGVMLRLGIRLPLGIIPAGTSNDFAKALGMPAQISRSCRKIMRGKPCPIDIGKAGDVYFVNVFSMGLYTDTSQKVPTRVKNIFGNLAYYAVGFAESIEFRKMELTVETDGYFYSGQALMLFVLNGRTAGGLRIGKLAELDDGKLDVILIKSRSFLNMAEAGMNLLISPSDPRDISDSGDVVYLHCSSLDITSAQQEVTDVDGQGGPRLPVHVECVAGAVDIIL